MSKIFAVGAYTVHVWPNDHLPVHCHVMVDHGDSEIRVFLPGFEVEYKSGKPLQADEIKAIIAVIRDHKHAIGKEWRRLHGN